MRWLHLSDLHLIYSNYDTEIMRTSFIEYLEKHFANSLDTLFITGDITHQGNDYTQEVDDFLNEIVTTLQITKDRVYMIPGNHDIKRNALMGHVIGSIMGKEDPKKAINEIDEESFSVLYNGQQSFKDLYERFLGREYPKDQVHFVIKTEEYNVLHINTCLIAGGDNVEGHILIGLQKLLATLKQLEKDKPIFALGHHTVNCINEAEKQSFLNRLSDSEIDVYLCGHVHKSKIHQESNNYRTTHMFTAGANVVDGYSDTIFIEGQLDSVSGKAEVVYHTWNSSDEFWHVNNSLDRRLVNGKYEFEIEKIKKKIKPEKLTSSISLPGLETINKVEFKSFIIDFYNVLSNEKLEDYKENFVPKDVTDKFENMLCSVTLGRRYDEYATYFPIVNQIFKSSSFVGFEKKHLVPNLVSKYYMKVLHKYNNGDEIFVAMTEMIAEKYSEQMDLAEEVLEVYISIFVCWGIHECDIYNEMKKGVS
jgi:UDP-2,3-diacylglucosamine pyrophosphatase LpxH